MDQAHHDSHLHNGNDPKGRVFSGGPFPPVVLDSNLKCKENTEAEAENTGGRPPASESRKVTQPTISGTEPKINHKSMKPYCLLFDVPWLKMCSVSDGYIHGDFMG